MEPSPAIAICLIILTLATFMFLWRHRALKAEATAMPEGLKDSYKALYAHAEDMTCHLDKTDDTSDYAYLERARQFIKNF